MAECDFSMVLSQDMIAQVVEDYLNKKELKQPVEVVDLQNTDAGYIFFLKRKPKVAKVDNVLGFDMPNKGDYNIYVGGSSTVPPTHIGRSKNGRFTKKEVSNG